MMFTAVVQAATPECSDTNICKGLVCCSPNGAKLSAQECEQDKCTPAECAAVDDANKKGCAAYDALKEDFPTRDEILRAAAEKKKKTKPDAEAEVELSREEIVVALRAVNTTMEQRFALRVYELGTLECKNKKDETVDACAVEVCCGAPILPRCPNNNKTDDTMACKNCDLFCEDSNKPAIEAYVEIVQMNPHVVLGDLTPPLTFLDNATEVSKALYEKATTEQQLKLVKKPFWEAFGNHAPVLGGLGIVLALFLATV